MARKAGLIADAQPPALVRAAGPDFAALNELLFRRYPDWEWATFARFGWRDTPTGLVLTLAAIDAPLSGDLDEEVGHVAIQEPYTLRTALAAEEHPLAVGVIHSHPLGCDTSPSTIDDGMDGYYATYFADFAPGRPYVTLIFSRREGQLYGTGRVHWRGAWFPVGRFLVDGVHIGVDNRRSFAGDARRRARLGRVARLASAFGEEAAERLARACVGVLGTGGTGSPAIEVLARAGVGRIIGVDPDVFSESNLERLHGSVERDIGDEPSKVAIARRHVEAINSGCQLTMIRGRLPQVEVIDALIHADVVLGCTDQQHSRLALSDLALRYAVPVLDCGVALEGRGGRISGQIIQILRMLPSDSCVLCREMVSAIQVSQELMSDEERRSRMAAAAEAEARGERGERGDAYWRREAQLNTVGYITTTAGAMAAGYAIGWMTGRFDPPFTRLQMNILAPFLDVTDADVPARPDCTCRRVRGQSDQAIADALVTAPKHWPPPTLE